MISSKSKKKDKKTILTTVKKKRNTKFKIWNPIKGFNRWKDQMFPQDSYMINMEMRNGTHNIFMISTSEDNFNYENGTYLIDDDVKYYVNSSKMYCLDYHQDFPAPFRRRIEVNKVINDISSSGAIDIEKATNPSTIKKFIEKEVIQQAIKGVGKLQEELNLIRLLQIINLVLLVVLLIIIVKGSGMLNNIKIPGF